MSFIYNDTWHLSLLHHEKFEYYKKRSFIEHLSSASISFWRSPCCDWLRRQIMEWQWPLVSSNFTPGWLSRSSSGIQIDAQGLQILLYLKLFPKISHKILKEMDGWHWCCNYTNHSISVAWSDQVVALLRSYLVLVTVITVMQRQYIYYKRRKK